MKCLGHKAAIGCIRLELLEGRRPGQVGVHQSLFAKRPTVKYTYDKIAPKMGDFPLKKLIPKMQTSQPN